MKYNCIYFIWFSAAVVSLNALKDMSNSPGNSVLQYDLWTNHTLGERYSSFRNDVLYPLAIGMNAKYFYDLEKGLKYDLKLSLALDEFRCRDANSSPKVKIIAYPQDLTETWTCNETQVSTAYFKNADSYLVELIGDWGENGRLLITITSYYETIEKCPPEFSFDCMSIPDRCKDKDPDDHIRPRECIYGSTLTTCDTYRNCPQTSYDEDKSYCDVPYCDDYDYDIDIGFSTWYILGPVIGVGAIALILVIYRWRRQKLLRKKVTTTTFIVAQPVQRVMVVSDNFPETRNHATLN